MRKTLRALFIFTFLVSISAASAQDTYVSNKPSSMRVNAFSEDSLGFIWLGTSNGINRYNGSTYTIYFDEEGQNTMEFDNILDMFHDEDGTLWFSSECGFSVLRNGRILREGKTEALYNPINKILNINDTTVLTVGIRGLGLTRKSDLQFLGGYYQNGMSSLEHIIISSKGQIWFSHESNDSTFIRTLENHFNIERNAGTPGNGFREVFCRFIGKDVKVNGICELPDGSIIVSTEKKGMKRFLGKEEIPLSNNLKRMNTGSSLLFIQPFLNGILVGQRNIGIRYWDMDKDIVTTLFTEEKLNGTSYTCFVDSKNNIYLADHKNGFKSYKLGTAYEFLTLLDESSTVSHLIFDEEGNLWAIIDKKLTCIDPDTGQPLYEGTRTALDLKQNSIGEFMVVHENDVSIFYPPKAGGITLKRKIEAANGVFGAGFDRNGNIYAMLFRGLEKTDPEGNTQRISNPGIPFYIFSDPKSSRIFLNTYYSGLFEIMPDDTFVPHKHLSLNNPEEFNLNEIDSEAIFNISCYLVAENGELWLGTYNNGIYRVSEDKHVTQMHINEGLVGNDIRSIIEDRNGNIWFSTKKNINKYDIRTQSFSTIHDRYYTEGKSYDPMSVAIAPDGRLYFGGSGHITVIDPDKEISASKDIPLYIDAITINGKTSTEDISLLDLRHNQNNLTFRLSGLDIDSESTHNYTYRLDGYDNDWNYTTNNIKAEYTHLPVGQYTFKARIRNHNGDWSSSEINLPLTIHPSPWLSPLAKSIYIAVLIAVILLVFWIILKFQIQKERVSVIEQREEMKQEQIDFYTNISHELRTPLSLIYAPAKQLESIEADEKKRDIINSIIRNAERLQNLSEQIIESNPENQRARKLCVHKGDIVTTINSVIENFRFASLEKSLSVHISSPESIIGWYDNDKIGKIFSNLISNAIKYTPYGRCINIIILCNQDGQTTISVSDEGIGIPEDKRNRIFNRFDRIDSDGNGIKGYGIGLNFAYELALQHKGNLSYQPVDTGGSVFTLSFPTSKDRFSSDEIDETPYTQSYGLTSTQEDNADSQKQGSILIIEDTEELCRYLRNLFSDTYRVICASDGLEAIDCLHLGVPDLVISDIIMPSMNGYELCNAIKTNDEWHHLPVILLTAKSDAQSSLMGYKAGADAYISKPFDPENLTAVVESLIRNRRIIQQKVLDMTSSDIQEGTDDIEYIPLSPREKLLMEKIHKIMEENLGNDKFGVEDMAQELGMSYSSLYAKMKSLTGKTPLFYIKNYRMNKAKELLATRLYTVSEVALKVGILAPNVFSRDFKKHFGVKPSSISKA